MSGRYTVTGRLGNRRSIQLSYGAAPETPPNSPENTALTHEKPTTFEAVEGPSTRTDGARRLDECSAPRRVVGVLVAKQILGKAGGAS